MDWIEWVYNRALLRAAIWSTGPVIEDEDLKAALLQVQPQGQDQFRKPLGQGFDLQALLDEVSQDYIAKALKQTGDRKTFAAKLLGFANHQTLAIG